MNLTEEKKAPIRGRDMSFKRNMLSMHFRGAAKVFQWIISLFHKQMHFLNVFFLSVYLPFSEHYNLFVVVLFY